VGLPGVSRWPSSLVKINIIYFLSFLFTGKETAADCHFKDPLKEVYGLTNEGDKHALDVRYLV
jgi:hypothetical protein